MKGKGRKRKVKESILSPRMKRKGKGMYSFFSNEKEGYRNVFFPSNERKVKGKGRKMKRKGIYSFPE